MNQRRYIIIPSKYTSPHHPVIKDCKAICKCGEEVEITEQDWSFIRAYGRSKGIECDNCGNQVVIGNNGENGLFFSGATKLIFENEQ